MENKFKGNSDERMIELYQERIAGVKHEIGCVGGSWVPRSGNAGTFCTDVEYRIVKQTRVINGITVPMCMTEKPEVDETYYAISINDGDVHSLRWDDVELDHLTLDNGLAFHSELDAIETMEAILSGTRL